MASSENDASNKQAAGNDVHEETHTYEDEINLIDYFIVLWKRKWLILVFSILPTLVVGLTLFFLPRSYEVTYVYDVRDDVSKDVRENVRDDVSNDVSNWNLDEKNYDVLISRFYSEENLSKIIDKLRENGLDEYAELVGKAENSLDDLKDLLKFKPLPAYIDLSKAKITDPRQLQQIRKLTAQLLDVTIVGKPKEDLPKIASVIRENLENVIPVYMVQEQLSADMRTYKTGMADIESNRFSVELTLKTRRSALEKLKSIKTRTPDKIESDVTLQFNVGGRIEYVPLGYQIQAVESKIVELEEQVEINKGQYSYYKDLLALSEKLSAGLKSSISSYYTIQQFHSLLTKLIDNYKTEELKDYLASYIKRIENRISASVPITENPKISLVARGTTKKIAIVFAIALMLSVFAVFLLEGLKKSQAQAS